MLRKFRESVKLKIVIPVFLSIFILLMILGLISYWSQVRGLTKELEADAELTVNEVINMYNQAVSSEEDILDLNNQNAVALAKLIARLIKENPGILTTTSLTKLAQDLGIVDEIHVIDASGKIAYGTVPDFLGFDFHSSEQTKPFLEGLSNPDFELAQEPQLRGADNTLFQYIGVGRLDQPGIVQVGISADTVKRATERSGFQNILRLSVSEGIESWVIDDTGTVLYHGNQALIGKKADEIGIDKQKVFAAAEGGYYTKTKGKEIYIYFKKVNQFVCGVGINVEERLSQAGKNFGNFMLIGLVGLFITILLINLIVTRFVVRPIVQVAAGTTEIASGKLQRNLDIVFDDEIGLLTKNFNTMTDSLRELIKKITYSANKVSENSQELAAVTNESSRTAQQMASTIEELAHVSSNQAIETQNGSHSVQEMSDSFKVITAKTREALNSAEKAESISSIGLEVVNKQIAIMSQVKTTDEKVSGIVRSLAHQAEDIVGIVNTISAISNQINLLALNAAIEAARAGEYGRGFSVVAEEVRNLAGETANATKTVEKIIDQIKTNIEAAVKEITLSGEVVNAQTKAGEETQKYFTDMYQMAQKITEQMQQIVSENNKSMGNVNELVQMIENLSASAEEAAANAEEASAASEEQTAAMEQVAGAAENLARLVQELQEMAERFEI